MTEKNTSFLLKKAFIKLTKAKSYEKIQVKEITAEAGLSRRVFYKKFHSKADLAESIKLDLIQDFQETIQSIRLEGKEPTVQLMHDVIHFFLMNRESIGSIEEIYNHKFINLIFEDIGFVITDKILQNNTNITKEHAVKLAQYVNTFLTLGFNETLQKWLHDPAPISERELCKLAQQFIVEPFKKLYFP